MRLPRDVSGRDLVRALERLGYEMDRQSGSHMRLVTSRGGVHHVTVPNHDPIKIGTLNSILKDVAAHHGLDREALVKLLS